MAIRESRAINIPLIIKRLLITEANVPHLEFIETARPRLSEVGEVKFDSVINKSHSFTNI